MILLQLCGGMKALGRYKFIGSKHSATGFKRDPNPRAARGFPGKNTFSARKWMNWMKETEII